MKSRSALKLLWFPGLFALSTIGNVFGQIERSRPFPSEALEKYEDAPAYIWRTDVSPRMISQHDAFTSYQVNVNSLGQNVTGDAANEPSICVDPTNHNKMAIGWRQFNSVTSSFRTGGYAYSANGGTSWTFPGTLTSGFRSDPVLFSDFAGNFLYLSLVPNFFCDIWRSNFGGQFWQQLGPAKGGDKQWLTIDNTNSRGHGFLYQSWSAGGNNFEGRLFTRSTDGGFNWMDPIFIPNSPSFGTLEVDSAGNLFIGGINADFGSTWCVRSSDAKNATITPTFDRVTEVPLPPLLINEAINGVGLVGQIFLAVDRSGTVTGNNIYMLASTRRFEASNGSDVLLSRSQDGGQSFEPPVRINDDHLNESKWHWLGTMAVAPNGRIDVVWLDTRNAANNTDSQLFYAYSLDGGNTWSRNLAVSNSFNPFVGYPNQAKMGDYITIVSDDGGGNVAYTATFNNEEDIYYVRVAPIAPAVLSAASRKVHGANGPFDIPLPLSGPAGIECRSGGASGNYQVVVTFGNPVTVGAVSVTSRDGLASATPSVNGAVVTIDLANVANAQTLALSLTNVNDGQNLGDVAIPLGVLVGDTNGNGTVTASDISQTKAASGQPVSGSNFREDVTANGGVINASDIGLVKSQAGSQLP